MGGAIGNVNRNAPFVVQNFFAVASVLSLLMLTAFSNNASIRDFQHNTHQMIFSLPVSRRGFLWGRFWGSTLVGMLPCLGVSIAVLLGKYMPWVDHERFGPVFWDAHWNGLLCFVIPNTIFLACLLFPVGLYFAAQRQLSCRAADPGGLVHCERLHHRSEERNASRHAGAFWGRRVLI